MLKPIFKLEYEQIDITNDVSKYVLSIDYTDFLHGQSDEINITLLFGGVKRARSRFSPLPPSRFEDSEEIWQADWIPSKGDTLKLSIGYDGEELLNCGTFIIDEIEFFTPPDTIVVKALITSIKKSLRQKNSIAYENKTLKQIANEIAKKHDLELIGEIDDIKIARVTQGKKADLTFLKKLAEEYGYIFKVTDTKLVFYKTEKLKEAEPTRIFYKNELSRINLSTKTVNTHKAVEVSYHNPTTGKTIKSTVQNVVNTKVDIAKLSVRCENKQPAILKAQAQLDVSKEKIEGNIDMFGESSLVSGINIELKDIGYFSGKYLVKEVKHHLDRGFGYTTSLSIENA